MRGSVIKRGSTYSIVLDRGRGPDGKRQRKWHSGYRTRKDAERARVELLAQVDHGIYVEPSRLTEHGREKGVLVPARRALSRGRAPRDGQQRDHPMSSSRLSGSRRILSAPTPTGLQEGCTATMTAQRTAPQHSPDQGGCFELAPGLEPGSAVYKTGADRPPGAGACCPCSSRRVGRPASALLTAQVVPGGMTTRMTSCLLPTPSSPPPPASRS
jgi:hypothetical protein